MTDHEPMKLRAVRSLLVVAVALLALALPALAAAGRGEVITDRGVVQSISPAEITLRELDGTVVTLPVGPATRVRVNGAPARLADVRPGFVATVLHRGSRSRARRARVREDRSAGRPRRRHRAGA